MAISFVRIDDRVIHGQTTTRWSKEFPIDGFIVVGDDIVNDDLRRKVLKAAAGNLKIGIYSEDVAPEKINLAKKSDKNFFLITNSPQVFSRLIDKGVDLGDSINVGPMNTRDGAKIVSRTVAIDKDDYRAFENIYNNNIDITFQLIPEDDKKKWPQIKAKFDELNFREEK